jgi:hypothetical protein
MKRRQTIAWFIAMCLCALWYINVNIRQQIPGLTSLAIFSTTTGRPNRSWRVTLRMTGRISTTLL